MIDKIVSIHNVGKFERYTAIGDVSFGKLALVYAENAQGKTTIAAILRSLSTGEPRWIEERRTIGAQEDPEVFIRVDENEAHFRKGKWNRVFASVEIFDSTFVNDNVYAGEAIEFDHRQNLYRFAIGQDGVRLSKKVEDQTAAIGELNKQLRQLKEKIQRHTSDLVDDEVDTFIALPPIEGVDEAIEQKSRDMETLRQADAIASRPVLSELRLPEVPLPEIKMLLSTELPDVSADAESKVKRHLAAYMDEQGEAWLRQGMRYISGERCPFCGQDIRPAELIAAYRAYFSQAYSELKEEIGDRQQRVQELMSRQNIVALQRNADGNVQHAEFWRDHVPAKYPQVNVEEVIHVLENLRERLTQHLERKAASPLTPVMPDKGLRQAMTCYTETVEQLDTYNREVQQANSELTAKKTVVAGGDLGAAQRALKHLEVSKLRHSHPVDQICIEYCRQQGEKKTAEEQKEAARTELSQYTAELLNVYQRQINRHLARFGADFQIVGTQEGFSGGNPSMDYHLQIKDQQVPLSEQPAACFRNTLSSGDKATLAFAFFLARVELDATIEDKVVLFDDPTSRLDCFRRKTTSQAIGRIASRARQVIILSYDPYLLRDIWDDSPTDHRHSLRLARTGTGTRIAEWDICKDTETPYERNYFMLNQFWTQGTHSPDQDALRGVAQCIRPLLEHYLRGRCPRVFTRNCWLGDMIKHIDECPPNDAANCLKPLVQELTDIKDYSAPFHHDQNPKAGDEPVTDSQLRAYVGRTLKLLIDPPSRSV